MIMHILTVITRGHVLATINNLEKLWSVEFDVTPRGVKDGWTSLLHANSVGNTYRFGTRVPGVFFKSMSRVLHICAPYTYPTPFECVDLDNHELPINQATRIKIQQLPSYNDNRFVVSLNGAVVINYRAPYVTTFSNVKVYEANPWQEAANVDITNYVFHSGIISSISFKLVIRIMICCNVRPMYLESRGACGTSRRGSILQVVCCFN